MNKNKEDDQNYSILNMIKKKWKLISILILFILSISIILYTIFKNENTHKSIKKIKMKGGCGCNLPLIPN